MSQWLLATAFGGAQVMLALAMACAALRLMIGPRAQDRVLALDTLYVEAMLLILVFGMREGSDLYFEIALVIGMLGFVSTAALAKFLLRGEVIEGPAPTGFPPQWPPWLRCWSFWAPRSRSSARSDCCDWARSTSESIRPQWEPRLV